jgi:hypothetical protein
MEHMGHIKANGRILLKWVLKIVCWDVEWIHLPEDRIQWQAF